MKIACLNSKMAIDVLEWIRAPLEVRCFYVILGLFLLMDHITMQVFDI
jgi:hypothetical protein